MPPFIIPSVVKFAVGALGAGVIVHWVVKELRHINDELDRAAKATSIDPIARETLPTLRRDPRTGDWRVT
jgi:hypothetical protein